MKYVADGMGANTIILGVVDARVRANNDHEVSKKLRKGEGSDLLPLSILTLALATVSLTARIINADAGGKNGSAPRSPIKH